MRKNLKLWIQVSLLACIFLVGFAQKASAQAAPEKYEGVMLQAFYWDSQTATSWNALKSQADEISKSFGLVWLPPSGNDLYGHMGYHPVYYFNQNSAFGTQAELKSLISTLKTKGTLSIADIVVNHRNGVTNWTDFPTETYKGITYKWGPEAICQDDEVAGQADQAKPTGWWDTGEGWSGARDIDYTNENVRNTIKAYLDFMKNEIGYAGWRYDVSKGYSSYYAGEYNTSAGCEFSVGEYWDSGFDNLAAFMEGTKWNGNIRAGAFDFSLKYLLNEACNNGAWDKLVWLRDGTLRQPAGLIHSDTYARYAYTFVDNHDTWRPGTSAHSAAVTKNELAGNAFIIAHPGIPTVFYPHWNQWKAQIKPMIEARKLVGIHSQSKVNVLETNSNVYFAEVFGKKGSLLIKVGPQYSVAVPAGYTLYTSGENYAIWTKGGTNDPVTVTWKNSQSWSGSMYVYGWNDNGIATSAWPGTKVTADASGKYTYKFATSPMNVILTNGTNQTVDISYVTSNSCYTIASTTTGGKYNVNLADCSTLKSVLTADNIETQPELVSIYPNPATESFSVVGVDADEITVSSVSGQVVTKVAGYQNNINIQSLTPGIYVLQVKAKDGRVYNQKLMKK